MTKTEWKNYFAMLIPLFVCEFLWVLGENVYAVIYGHLGTLSCAGMTLTYPIQGLLIGSLSGLSQGAGIIIGKSQGMKEEEKSYADAKRTLFFGLAVSVLFSLLLILMNRFYINLYKIEDDTKNIGSLLLIAFAIFNGSSSIRTTSAASMAASEPSPPMAIPTSARVRAGASFMPSPIMATVLPSPFSFSIISAF